mmetsp:Transcript_55233/g.147440  ORF Transcript_55233/g.147440 Transcript_55233/m.147440 type:complete len:124 (+) Transcript_55233:474-845(+)
MQRDALAVTPDTRDLWLLRQALPDPSLMVEGRVGRPHNSARLSLVARERATGELLAAMLVDLGLWRRKARGNELVDLHRRFGVWHWVRWWSLMRALFRGASSKLWHENVEDLHDALKIYRVIC